MESQNTKGCCTLNTCQDLPLAITRGDLGATGGGRGELNVELGVAEAPIGPPVFHRSLNSSKSILQYQKQNILTIILYNNIMHK